MRKSKCRGIPSRPALLTERGTLPAQKPGWRESPSEDSADKMTRETCPEKSSNGKEKRPRSRRENVSVPGFFRPSPEIKIPSPGISFSGLGISRSDPEFSRRTAQKVICSDKILHRSPILCKKNRAEISYLGRITQKPRYENQPKRNNLSVFTSISRHSDFCRRCGIPAAQSQDWPPSPADMLRNKNCGFPNPWSPQGLSENIYERHIFNRYIFAD